MNLNARLTPVPKCPACEMNQSDTVKHDPEQGWAVGNATCSACGVTFSWYSETVVVFTTEIRAKAKATVGGAA